ncbi:hypothetical protein MMPV_008966 [Pyropia vietnamensis]
MLWAPSTPDDGDAALAAGTPADATYNFCTGIYAAEARRGAAALETLLCDAAARSAAHLADSDGRYPVLDGVVAAAGRVLVGARVGVPLGTLVRGKELVLWKADEWHRHFAAPALRLDGAMRGLAAATAAWRGVEFASWPKLLAARAATAAGRAAAYFPQVVSFSRTLMFLFFFLQLP